MKKRIKDTIQKYLWILLSANLVIYIVIYSLGYFKITATNDLMTIFLNPKSFLFILSPILTLILNGVFPNCVKEFLVFWRFKDRLPGFRAFSKHIYKDQRINVESLKALYGKFPRSSDKQNQLWYSMYLKVQDETLIWGSHRDFLLTRDLTSISFIILCTLGVISFFTLGSINIKLLYLSFLIIQFFIISISARNYGNRFVRNVLSYASNNIEEHRK